MLQRRFGGRDDPASKTNANLQKLLSKARLDVGAPPDRDNSARVYLANAVLCMKAGKMSAPVADRWIKTCADHHLRQLAAHLKAPVVVGMGSAGWQAARRIFELGAAPKKISDAVGSFWEASGTLVFAVGHCGPLGLANRSWDRQVADWERIGDAIRERL